MGKTGKTAGSEKSVRAALRRGANVVPLVRELRADTTTPVGAFLRLRRGPSFLLESVEGGERSARFSFLGARPFETLLVRGGRASATRGGRRAGLPGCPFRALGERLARYRALPEPGLPRFCGGAVGHLGYEMSRHIEPASGLADPGGTEARLDLFSAIVAFDRVRHAMVLISNVVADGEVPAGRAYRDARDRLDEMEAALAGRKPRCAGPHGGQGAPGLAGRRPSNPADRRHGGASAPPGLRPRQARAALGEKAFLAGVRGLKAAIREGEIFQAVLSDRFEAPLMGGAFEAYRRLRSLNPSPYMFYIGEEDEAVFGASPEMLVRVENGVAETRPIAGTRPRGADEEGDRRHERDLLASVKERAEHLMLVDLGRNDIGRVARPGTVSVPSFMEVERYSHVMHLVSSVRGRLGKGLSAWDAFGACFPAGTVSGAPKIRAMKLVSEIERSPRGFYAGAVVYHDFQGNLDSAIAIRSASASGGRVRVQAGAGIVADSRPSSEWREVRSKARAMLEAVGAR